MPLKTLIIEDEADAVELITKIIEQSCPELEIIGKANSVEKGINSIKELNPELVLMDVSLGDKKCFEILEHFRNHKFALVFTTAYENYALEAFQHDAVHYMLKPYSISGFRKMIDKLILLNISKGKQIKILSHDGGIMLLTNDIEYLQAERAYCKIYMHESTCHTVTKSLSAMESIIEDTNFLRVHSSYLVNMTFVSKIVGENLELINGSIIPIARGNKVKVKEFFGFNK